MSKKLLSVVLALALALSTFAVGAFAIGAIGYEDEADVASYTQAWSLSEAVNNGDGTYSVDVILDANYGVGPIQFQVIKTVNAGTLTLTGATINEEKVVNEETGEKTGVIPENWMADIAFLDSTGEVAINPNPEEDGVSAVDVAGGKVIATLTYTASSDVAATLAINVADAKSATNPGGTLIAARMSDGNVVTGTAITGQTVSQTTNTITIGSAAVTEYTVSFAANGGSGSMADVTVEDGDSYTLPACTFTAPTGMQFAGWTVNGTDKAVGDTITVTANTTVTAKWTAIMYTVSFAAGDGSGSMASQSVAHGATYTLPANGFTAPSGYEFKAWSVGGAEKAVGDTITVTADTTVTAVWVKSIVPPTLAVKADTIGVIDTSRTTLNEIEGTECDGYIYGVEPENGEAVADIFEVVGDGTMNVVPTDAGEGTGTMVQVLDTDGKVVAQYVLIIFGDVDGDGVVTTSDSGAVELHDAYIYGYNFETWEDELGLEGRMTAYQVFAADLDGDTEATTSDSGAIELHDAYIYGYNFETWEDELGLNGRFTQEYIISKL